jgi:hypothetical protein
MTANIMIKLYIKDKKSLNTTQVTEGSPTCVPLKTGMNAGVPQGKL